MKRFALTSQKGILGERLAERYLRERGFAIVTTNYYQAKGKRQGEIDIVAIKKEILYFIEVKLRQVQSGAKPDEVFPEAAVTRAKLARAAARCCPFFTRDAQPRKRISFWCARYCLRCSCQNCQSPLFAGCFFLSSEKIWYTKSK
jgi:Holliday junction resolvase-like predicted endonuclease